MREALDKVRDEMAKANNRQIQYLGEGVTVLLQHYPHTAEAIGADGKSLKDCLTAIRNAARSGVADPATATEAILKYYGIADLGDPARLAAEVNLALCGGAPAPHPAPPPHCAPSPSAKAQAPSAFDIDALLEGL